MKHILTLVFSLTMLTLSAQLDLGEQYLEQGQYQAAMKAFQKENGKDQDIVRAYFEMSQLLAKPEFEGYNLDSAYYYVNYARRLYGKLSNGKQKRLDKEESGSRAMSRLRNAVADSALANIRRHPSIAAYEQFLSYYQRCRRTIKEAASKDMLLLVAEKAAAIDDFSELTKLYETYGREMRSRLRDEYAQLQNHLFKTFIKENGWKAFNKFSAQFPYNPYVTDRAKGAFLKIRSSGNIDYYNNFLRYYTSSPYAAIARDSIQVLQRRKIQSEQKIEALIAALPDLSDSTQIQEADQQLVTRFEQIMTVEQLETKLKGLDIRQLPKTMDRIYQYYRASSSMARLKSFKEKYPNYHNMDQVEADIFKLEMAASGESEKMKERDELIRVYAPRYEAFVALQGIIAQYIKEENWDEALAKVKGYLPLFKADDTKVKELIQLLEAPVPEVEITKLGGQDVNSEDSEYTPVLSADGEVLYFCRKQGDFYRSRAKEDIYFATLENGRWSEAQQIQDFDMSDAYFAPVSITTDGNRMLVFKGGTLAYTDKTKTGWSELVDFPENINATAWQGAATISSNSRVIIFEARYRPDALPSRINDHIDLFVALQNEKGEWDQVFSLGETINTPFSERSPFLHPDNRTLYFSSAGHGGLGGLDVFKTTRLDDSWTQWSKPEHLGKIINTATDDWGYKISTDGSTAYFSVAPRTTGNSDIYQVVLPEELRPELVSTITLTVMDKDGTPVEADVLLEDLTTGKIIGQLRTDPRTGKVFAVLPHEGRYSYVITKEGYFPRSNHVDLLEEGDRLEVDEVIELQKIEEMIGEETTIRLNNLFFDLDEFTIRAESYPELDRMADIVKKNNLSIEVLGHTDNTGSAEYNKKLSENRANSVKEYLVRQGIEAAKITIRGFGETQPVTSNDTEEGRARNRRVEVRFVE